MVCYLHTILINQEGSTCKRIVKRQNSLVLTDPEMKFSGPNSSEEFESQKQLQQPEQKSVSFYSNDQTQMSQNMSKGFIIYPKKDEDMGDLIARLQELNQNSNYQILELQLQAGGMETPDNNKSQSFDSFHTN